MVKTQKQIDPQDLVAMDDYVGTAPIAIDLVYADGSHPENIFKTLLYKPDAKFWLHREMAEIVLEAASALKRDFNATLVLKDGLRPVEAQQAMMDTDVVKANPHWTAPGPNRLLASPGVGGHPRGMAVDVTVWDDQGNEWDMGTSFDHLSTDPQNNPANRSYTNLPDHVLENRKRLQDAFETAAQKLGRPMLPLPSEWWDFRFPASYSEQYAPLSDNDLLPTQRMVI